MVRRWVRGNAPRVHVPGTSLYHTKSYINMLDLDKKPTFDSPDSFTEQLFAQKAQFEPSIRYYFIISRILYH